MKEIRVRAYAQNKPWAKRTKFLLPNFCWLLLLMAGVVSAAVLGPKLTATQTVSGVTLTFQASPNGVDSPIAFGVVDTVILDASNTNSVAYPAFTIKVTNSLDCPTLSASIQDSNVVMGKIEFQPLGSTYAQITVPTVGAAPCTFSTPTYNLPVGTSVAAGSFKWAWAAIPGAPVTWTFQPNG